MSVVGAMVDRKDRPAYVRFERRPMKDNEATEREGRHVDKDVDFVLVTAPYSRDVFEQEAKDWFAQRKRDVQNGRLPAEWYDRWVDGYERWKRNEEIPLHGTPIKGWPVISPAQMKNLIAINILTVEDLAAVNDEGKRRIGMGAQDLCDKAKAWLSQAKDKGPLTIENANLKAENRALKNRNELLEARVKELAERLDVYQRGGLDREQHFDPRRNPGEIESDDIIDPVEPVQVKRGRPRKQTEGQI